MAYKIQQPMVVILKISDSEAVAKESEIIQDLQHTQIPHLPYEIKKSTIHVTKHTFRSICLRIFHDQ